MDWVTISLTLVGGLIMLVLGGELLVRGASRIAMAFGISPLVIGLTVVAFGTSAPELAVSIQAGMAGNPDIALGNVVGSNIFNVLFILGACALILPLIVSRQLVRREIPIMIISSLLLLLMALDGRIGLFDGLLLFVAIVVYTGWSIVQSRRETATASDSGEGVTLSAPVPQQTSVRVVALAILGLAVAGIALGWLSPIAAGMVAAGALVFLGGPLLGRSGDTAQQLGLILAGLGTLVLGAGWLIEAASSIARSLGVSDLIIGLTIVAAGTSLPEVATSIIATIRRERDIAIGNVVGSNIFNILGILGLSAIITPGGLAVNPLMLSFDLPIMIVVALACLPIFFTGFTIARWEGLVFLGSYIAYTLFLILTATSSPALGSLTSLLLLLLPLVAATLAWTSIQALRAQRRVR